MRAFLRYVVFVVVILTFFPVQPTYASQLKSIDAPTGVLSFDDGVRAILEGVQLEDGALKVLAALLAGKESERVDARRPAGSPGVLYCYLFVDMKSLDFPSVSKSRVEPEKIMVNEFLLSQGLATVPPDLSFEKRQRFLNIQQEAKNRGAGIWSKEVFLKKRS